MEKTTLTDVIEKQKAARATEKTPVIEISDYKKLYTEECTKTLALENKCAEYEKLCKSYCEKERKATETLQRAILEYNARTQYMLDAARHAYMSMQFAVNAASKQSQGGEQ